MSYGLLGDEDPKWDNAGPPCWRCGEEMDNHYSFEWKCLECDADDEKPETEVQS